MFKKVRRLLQREDLQSLERFLKNETTLVLPHELARENLERGLVEISHYDGQHCANGLLIGRGYFITVKHTFGEGVSNKKIRDYQQREFDVYPKLFCSKKMDLALGRFYDSKEDFSEYSFLHLESVPQIIPSVLLTRKNGQPIIKGCLPCHTSIQRNTPSEKVLKNHAGPMYAFAMQNGENGDSGGIFATVEGRIMGFMKGSWEGEDKQFVYAVKANYIRNLVSAYLAKNWNYGLKILKGIALRSRKCLKY